MLVNILDSNLSTIGFCLKKKGDIRMASKNKELIDKLKDVKMAFVSKDLRGEDWDEMQNAVRKMEEVVAFINDCTGKGIEF